MNAYCMKCRTKREMKAPKEIKKKGRVSTTGTCLKCGTGMFVFGCKK